MTTENINGHAATSTDADGFLQTETPIVDAPRVETPDVAPNVEAQGPKKRGRKSNAEKARIAAEAIEAGGEAPKQTAAPKARKKAAYSDADIGVMAKQLVGLHHIGAMMTGMQELIISEQEATMLSAAIVNVSQQYDLAIDGKTGAMIQILGTAAMIYVPRVMSISQKAKARKANVPTFEPAPN
jgi:hypothetical protein